MLIHGLHHKTILTQSLSSSSRGSNVSFWLIFGLLSLCLSLSSSVTAASLEELEIAIEDAIAEKRPDYEERLVLVKQVYELVGETLSSNDPLVLKTQFVEAMANMRLGNFDRSREQIQPLAPKLNRDLMPALAFRTDALAAVLLIIGGEREQSLAAFEALFSRPNENVPAELLARTQIGYAVALNENGKAAQAVDMYEQLLLNAIRRQDDEITLIAGNNLIVILITLKDYSSARETLDQLRPVIARNPDSLVFGSLMLHDFELVRVGGNPLQAAAGLKDFIDEEIDPTPLMLGSAHLIYADSLRDLGRLDEAISQGEIALDMLGDQAHEVTAAHLSLAQTLILQGRYDLAIEQLGNVNPAVEPVPAKRVRYNQLLLAAMLRQGGNDDAAAIFDAYVAAEENRDELGSTTRAEFFEARLTGAKQTLELQQAEEFAQRQAEQREAERQTNRLLLIMVIAASLLTLLVIVLLIRRSAQRRRLEENTARNQELQQQVETKTAELRRNLEEQANIARELERRKRIDAIGMLVGNVAHDFNNLLQVVASSNEIVGSDSATKEDRSRALLLSEQSLDHGAKILRQLLTYTRQQDLEAKRAVFSEYLENTETLLSFALGEERTLVLEDHSNGSAVVVDTALLTTSLLNLISNAADAMPNGGTVTISANVITVPSANASWSESLSKGEYLRVRVADSGTGMSEKDLEHAIEPFFTTKDLHSGSGLGLSSVYGFVKQSGGDLRISSALGTGTTVEFLLPIASSKQSVAPEKTTATPTELEGMRLVLVEDNDMVAGVLERMLLKLKLEVTRAASGDEAQLLLQNDHHFDLLLTDIRMPGSLNGLDLARWVKSSHPQIGIVLMSGFIDNEKDFSEFTLIQKPFTAVEFAAALGKIRNGSGLRHIGP